MAVPFIEIKDQPVIDALKQLAQRAANPRPVLLAIGEDLTEDAKHRFDTTTGPDGVLWRSNSPVTIAQYIQRRGSSGKKAVAHAAAKKPLHGESGDLARQIFYTVTGNTLTVSSSPVYAAMQQFGGTKAEFPHLWGDIPARPFLPIKPSGELYPADSDRIVETIRDYLLAP